MKYVTIFYFIILCFVQLAAQSGQSSQPVNFGTIPGYVTLKCDFHQHTVFSDGSVWPNIRVQEALRESLDAIAITDHLEYQPHKKDIPNKDRNRSSDLAAEYAEDSDLIIIKGAEITRDLPPGHLNAIFLTDINALLLDDPVRVLNTAKQQNAFIFWNHPHWTSQKPDGIAELTQMHKMLIKEKLINGIEIVNEDTYSEEALQIALDNDLTLIGSSDIHGIAEWQFDYRTGGYRPLTLVFAEEKSKAALKQGLISGRTVVWFKGSLIGKSDYIIPLIRNALRVKKAYYIKNTSVARVELENRTDVTYIIQNISTYNLHNKTDIVNIMPRYTTTLEIKTVRKLDTFEVRFEVLNALVAPRAHPEISITVDISAP